MCHLTEIPPMRRIDLQPDVRGQKCTVLCGPMRVWVAGSVGADPRNSKWCREFCSPAKNCERRVAKFIYCRDRQSQSHEAERVAINTARRINDRYRASAKRLIPRVK